MCSCTIWSLLIDLDVKNCVAPDTFLPNICLQELMKHKVSNTQMYLKHHETKTFTVHNTESPFPHILLAHTLSYTHAASYSGLIFKLWGNGWIQNTDTGVLYLRWSHLQWRCPLSSELGRTAWAHWESQSERWVSSRQEGSPSVVCSEALCVLQTVCLHLDGHHVVTGDHG